MEVVLKSDNYAKDEMNERNNTKMIALLLTQLISNVESFTISVRPYAFASMRETNGCPDGSCTLKYIIAAYPIADTSQKLHNEYCMPCRVPINRGMRTVSKIEESSTNCFLGSPISGDSTSSEEIQAS